MKPLRLIELSVEPINQMKPTLKRMELIESRMLIRGFQIQFNAMAKLLEVPLKIIALNLEKSLDWAIANDDSDNINHIQSLMEDLNEVRMSLFAFQPYKLSFQHWDEENNCSIITTSQNINGNTIPFFMQPTELNCMDVVQTLELLGEEPDLQIVRMIDQAYDVSYQWKSTYFEVIKMCYLTTINVHFVVNLGIERDEHLIECLKKITIQDTNASIDNAIFRAFKDMEGKSLWMPAQTSIAFQTLEKSVWNRILESDPITPDFKTNQFKQKSLNQWYHERLQERVQKPLALRS